MSFPGSVVALTPELRTGATAAPGATSLRHTQASGGLAQSLAAIYGVMHALVDLCSVAVVFAALRLHDLPAFEGFYFVVGYDLLAFATQVLFGAVTDKLRAPRLAVILGLGLIALSTGLLRGAAVPAMILAGLGNASFHVGAGAIALRVSPQRAGPAGVFVAPGALGLALGLWLGRSGMTTFWPLAALLLVAVAVTLRLPAAPYPYDLTAAPVPGRQPNKWSLIRLARPRLAIALLLASVLVRSLIGFAGSYQCPKGPEVLFSLAGAVFIGKLLGGLASDRLGWIETSVGALLVSAPLIAFGANHWLVVAVGMLFFQMTMPVTLTAIALAQPAHPGFAFGLACLALILGALPTFFQATRAWYGPVPFVGLILVSALAVCLGLRSLGNRAFGQPGGDKPAKQWHIGS